MEIMKTKCQGIQMEAPWKLPSRCSTKKKKDIAYEGSTHLAAVRCSLARWLQLFIIYGRCGVRRELIYTL